MIEISGLRRWTCCEPRYVDLNREQRWYGCMHERFLLSAAAVGLCILEMNTKLKDLSKKYDVQFSIFKKMYTEWTTI